MWYRKSTIYLAYKLFLVLITVFLVSCSFQDLTREEIVKNEFEKFKISHRESIPIEIVFGEGVEKVCIQYPYEFEVDFKKRVSGYSWGDFEGVGDGYVVFWVFKKSHTGYKVNLSRAVMDYHPEIGSKCSSIDDVYIYSDLHGFGNPSSLEKKFYFK